MVYKGHIENGSIVLDEKISLPEGAPVRVDLSLEAETPAKGMDESSFYDRFKEFIGTAEGLPSDLAENHDHYLYGTPKK